MVARNGTGPKIARSITSCAECLAWGFTYAQGVCLACYNFSARFHQQVRDCRACRRWVPTKDEYCRLCWCQAREDRAITADDPRARVVLAPFLPDVRYHQLFFADTYRPQARLPGIARRHGAKGRPPKAPPTVSGRPDPHGAQLVLFTDLPRTYRYASVDMRSVAAPDNPWLTWALYLAHVMSETRGFAPTILRALNRNLVMLLTSHADEDTVRVSEFHRVLRNRNTSLVHVIDILSTIGVLVDDRPTVFDTWLETKLADLAPAVADHARSWAQMLRDGSPRQHPRLPTTAMTYLNTMRPALLAWSVRYDHLREVTRDDVLAYLDTLRGELRIRALVALRSLFGWAKREKVIFRNPSARIRLKKPPPPVWQRLSDDEIAAAIEAADTPQAKLCVVLAAVHAARPGHIRALQLDDVDLGNRRITIAGRPRPLDVLTYRVLVDWLGHRQRRWPTTANPHVLVSKQSALRHGPVSTAFLLKLRGLAATLERLRIDRQLEEAIACGADPRHLTAVFGINTTTAIRYATNAHQLQSP